MKVIRKIGQGDVEHVRSQLLQVGIFFTPRTVVQLEGAVNAATRLGLMLRAHINIYHPRDDAHIDVIMSNRQDHQHLFHSALSEPEFRGLYEKCDIIIVPDRSEVFTAEDVADGIIEAWTRNGGRFVGGNFGFLSQAELKRLHPTFDIAIDEFLERYANPF